MNATPGATPTPDPAVDDRPGPRRARTVVALPGTFCAPLVFERLRPLLGDDLPVRALSWMTDAPVHDIDGLAAWVAQRAAAADPEPVLLVGHSTGGAIALRVALTRPDIVAGLMLINTGPNMHGHGDVASLIATMERDGAGDVARAVIDRSFHVAPPPRDRDRLLAYGHAAPPRAAIDVLRSQSATDFGPELGTLRMPVTVVHGRFDGVRGVDVARGMVDAAPDATLWLVDAGHTPMFEAPEAVASALAELRARVDAR